VNFYFSDGQDVWLGMYRPNASNNQYDIRYQFNGKNIQYANWGVSDSNGMLGNEDCVAAFAPDYVWMDAT